jgi:BirA family biotin operon repressor/biotin-[acetyl-CoA-carboxylase] ligase
VDPLVRGRPPGRPLTVAMLDEAGQGAGRGPGGPPHLRMPLDIQHVRSQLPGRDLRYFPSIDTTMREAAALAEQNCAAGTVVVADEQTNGLGRHGHGWYSERGTGLYLSIVLRSELQRANAPTITMALGLATAEAIATVTNFACDLRWPNDIMIGPKKTAGILTQLLDCSAVAGIGINVNHQQFPATLSDEATSLRIETGRTQSPESLLIALLPAVDRYVAILEERGPAAILDLFSRRSSYASGKRVIVLQGDSVLRGTTAGLNESGFLVVRKDDGSDEIILAGGVRAASAGRR